MANIQKPVGASDILNQTIRKIDQSQNRALPIWTNGILIENLKFTSNVQRNVVHNLGRKPRGFIVMNLEIQDKSSPGPGASFSITVLKYDARLATILPKSGVSYSVLASLWFW